MTAGLDRGECIDRYNLDHWFRCSVDSMLVQEDPSVPPTAVSLCSRITSPELENGHKGSFTHSAVFSSYW